MVSSVFELSARDNRGREVRFQDFAGKVLLVVNTASKCGFTPQYEALQRLHQAYGPLGLVIVGFPCDQFAHQEPGDDEEIARFCQVNYGVTFPLMAKAEVNGPGTHPVFDFLKAKAPGFLGRRVKWNFTKFLVQRDGRTVKRFAPCRRPEVMEDAIRAALGS
jgi:glutathione peroxidase